MESVMTKADSHLKYALTVSEKPDDFIVVGTFDNETEAKNRLQDRMEKFPEDAPYTNLSAVQLKSKSVKYTNDADKGEEYAEISVVTDIDNKQVEACFNVQLQAGEYLPQMGCRITTAESKEDCDFTDQEQIIYELFNIAHWAEQAATLYDNEHYEYVDAEFNCFLNGNDLKIRVDKNNGHATLMLFNSDHSPTDYNIAYTEHQSFDSLLAAKTALDKFRIDGHHDCMGLYIYLRKARSDS